MMREVLNIAVSVGSLPQKGGGQVGVDPPAHPSTASFAHTRKKTANARKLRLSMTDAERKLWSKLRGAQLDGQSFRRQHPVGNYIADFWCADARLVVEVDGGQHGFVTNARRDATRTQWLERQGIKVIRFWNNDVLQNIGGVWDVIAQEIRERMPSTPTPTLPLSGGGSAGTDGSQAGPSRVESSQSGPSPGKGEDRWGLTRQTNSDALRQSFAKDTSP